MNNGSMKNYRQPETSRCGVCGVEIRKGLHQESAECMKAIVIGWVHLVALAGLYVYIILFYQ